MVPPSPPDYVRRFATEEAIALAESERAKAQEDSDSRLAGLAFVYLLKFLRVGCISSSSSVASMESDDEANGMEL